MPIMSNTDIDSFLKDYTPPQQPTVEPTPGPTPQTTSVATPNKSIDDFLKNYQPSGESPLTQAAYVQHQNKDDGIDYSKVETKHPVTAKYLTNNPDQIDNFNKAPQAVTDHEDAVNDHSILDDMWANLTRKETPDEMDAGLPSGIHELRSVSAKFISGIAKGVGVLLESPKSGSTIKPATYEFGKKILSSDIVKKLDAAADAEEKKADPTQTKLLDAISKGDIPGAANRAFLDLIGLVPTLATFGVMSVGAAAGVLGSQTIGESYTEAKQTGASEESARNTALTKGAISVPMSLFQGSKIMGSWMSMVEGQFGKLASWKFVQAAGITFLKNMGLGGTQGALQQIANNAADIHCGAAPHKDIFDGIPDATVNGMVMGTALALPGIAHAARANNNAALYEKVGRLISEHKLQATQPQQVELSQQTGKDPYFDFVKKIIKDTPYQNIRIDKYDWDNYMTKKGLDPVSVANELHIGYPDDGTEIVVPYERWLKTIGKTEHYNGLKKYIRFSDAKSVEDVGNRESDRSGESIIAKYKEYKDLDAMIANMLSNQTPLPNDWNLPPGEAREVIIKNKEGQDVNESGRPVELSQKSEIQSPERGSEIGGTEGALDKGGSETFYPGKQSEPIGEDLGRDLAKTGVDEGAIHSVVNKTNTGLFDDPKIIEAVKKTHDKAVKKIVGDIIARHERLQSSEYKEKLNAVKSDLAKEFDARPDVLARSVLVDRKMPDGSSLPDKYKDLPRVKMEDLFGEGKEKQGEEEGKQEDPIISQALANIFGYDTSDAMYRDMATVPDREEFLTAAAKAQLIFGEPEPSQQMAEALENKNANNINYLEMKYMASDHFAKSHRIAKGLIAPPKRMEQYKSQAEKIVENDSVSDVKPEKYMRALDKAREETKRAYGAGKYEAMRKAKENEIIQRMAFDYSIHASKDIQNSLDFNDKLAKQSTRKRMGAARGDHLGQSDAIRRRFELPGMKDEQPKKSLEEYVSERQTDGEGLLYGPTVMNQGYSINYKDMPYSQFKEVTDALKNIEAVTRNENMVMKDGVATHIDSVVVPMEQSASRLKDLKPTPESQVAEINWEKTKHFSKEIGATLQRFPFFWRRMDAFTDVGAHHNTFEKRTTENGIKEKKYFKTHEDKFRELFNGIKPQDMKNWKMKRFTVDAAKTKSNDVFPGHSGVFTKETLCNTLAYCGTENGIDGVLKAHGWDKSVLPELWKRLDSTDINIVKGMWKHTEFYKNEAFDVHERDTGVRPTEVKGNPFTIIDKDGKTHNLDGGYVPHRFLDEKAKRLDKEETAQQMAAETFGNANTYQKWAIKRVGTGGRMLDYSIDSWDRSIRKQIHDTCWRETVKDFKRIEQNSIFRNTIKSVAGQEGLDMIHNWINRLALGRETGIYDPYSKGMSRIANGINIQFVGASIGAMLNHLTSIATAAKEVGFGYFGRGIFEAGKKSINDIIENEHIQNAAQWMGMELHSIQSKFDVIKTLNNDEYIQQRSETGSFLEAADLFNKWDVIQNKSESEKLKNIIAYCGIKAVDNLRANINYTAAYMKVMENGIPENKIQPGDHEAAVDYARSVVKRYVGGSDNADISQLQAKGGLHKILTFFYSPFSTMYNQWASNTHQVAYDKNYGQYAIAMGLTLFVPAYLHSLVRGSEPDSDSDAVDWATWLVTCPVEFMTEAYPIARDLGEPIIKGLTTGKFTYPTSVLGQTAENLVHTATALNHPLDMTSRELQAIVDDIGVAGAWPTKAIWRGFKEFEKYFGED